MQLTDEQVAEEARFIDLEPGWPLWPLLPVKNIHRGDRDHPEDETHGVLVASGEGGKRTVWFKNLLNFRSGPLAEQLEGVKSRTFDSTEELVRAGWIGD